MPQTHTPFLPCRPKLSSRLLYSQDPVRLRPTTSSICKYQNRYASAATRPRKSPLCNESRGGNNVWYQGNGKTVKLGSLQVRSYATKEDWKGDNGVREDEKQELTQPHRTVTYLREEGEDGELLRALPTKEGASEPENEELRQTLRTTESILAATGRKVPEEVHTLYLSGKVTRSELENFAASSEQERWVEEDLAPVKGIASTLDERALEEGLHEQASDTGVEEAEDFKQAQHAIDDMQAENSSDFTVQDYAVQDPVVHDTESVVLEARQRFRDRLPEGTLTEEEYKIYERLYGAPLIVEEVIDENGAGDEAGTALLREGEDGELEEVDLESAEANELSTRRKDSPQHKRQLRRRGDAESKADVRLQKDMAVQATDFDYEAEFNNDAEYDDSHDGASDGEDLRVQPFTLAARFGTNPSTLVLPRAALTGPVTVMLGDLSNKHLDETSQRVFGGPGLPYSTGTPRSSRTMPQMPIPLTAGQAKMSGMEADVYCAAVMPGVYACVMSVLVEVRKRIGKGWLEGLFGKEEGPRILDAGAGGAGVLAWREILKAEWNSMHDGKAEEPAPPRLGKATVITGSATLRQRASVLLDNTTFLPRLPEHIHSSVDAADVSRKKQFDIIVAPHSLWCLQEDYMRRQMVQNLWSLLDPNGGVLVLLEKGVPRGFEVVAGARQHLLSELFVDGDQLEENEVDRDVASVEDDRSKSEIPINKTRDNIGRHPGRILAPCTNHNKCPMYTIPGVSKGRKDYCHFSQRYIRPPYFQRMLGAKDRNHEDVRFSYVAVQKGSLEGMGSRRADSLVGKEATDRAFNGYHMDDQEVRPDESVSADPETTASIIGGSDAATSVIEGDAKSRHFETTGTPLITNPLPRQILPPLKRKGHVILDLCTPSGTLERWTVSKSYSVEAYRDARKSKWGDMWALGAKTRVPRGVRLGRGDEDGSGRVKDVKGRGRAEKGDGEPTREAATYTEDERIKKRRGQKKQKASRREETRRLMDGEDV